MNQRRRLSASVDATKTSQSTQSFSAIICVHRQDLISISEFLIIIRLCHSTLCKRALAHAIVYNRTHSAPE